ncbi:MAG: MgtC/SapB family protein [Alphaproteobacteria bacterium]|nr:MgtC/SapB family protein [Alphaproteobacteria bacterium]
MEEWWAGIYVATEMPTMIFLGRLLVAGLLGAIIGIERESKARAAGLRTHVLTSVAAATFAMLTAEIVNSPMLQDDSVKVDPVRVIEAVTSGVAFLAAGAIIQGRGRVQGLTTGAGMWLAGAIGVACGMGYLVIAALAAGIGLATMVGLNRFSHDAQEAQKSPEANQKNSD